MKVAVTILVFCVAALLSLGMVMLFSSGIAKEGAHFLVMQSIWCGFGLLVCVAAAATDYRWLKKISWPAYVLALVLLAAVYLPHFGVKVNGAHRWIRYKGFQFQSSEFAKIALIICVAWYGEYFQRQMTTWKRGIVIPAVFIGLILGMIFIEPDRGATILMAAVCGTMLLVAGVQWKYLIPPVFLALVGLAFSIYRDPMRTQRIFSWLDVEKTKSGVGYQAYESMLALGAGGWTGLGLGNGRQKFGFIPEHHTDFIFSIIGEELGLVATLLVIVAFVAVVVCGIKIALGARDTFGMLLGTGISFLIGYQACINIGVVTSALPNKGLPLPFISYGGSNLIIMLASVGLLLSIARQSRAGETLGQTAKTREQLPEGQPA